MLAGSGVIPPVSRSTIDAPTPSPIGLGGGALSLAGLSPDSLSERNPRVPPAMIATMVTATTVIMADR